MCYHSTPLREESNLDQPRLFPVPETEIHKYIEPPSHVVVWDWHPSGTVVILSQQPTNVPDVATRPAFFKHKKGKHPKMEAMMLGSYIYEKSEAGKIDYGKGILI